MYMPVLENCKNGYLVTAVLLWSGNICICTLDPTIHSSNTMARPSYGAHCMGKESIHSSGGSRGGKGGANAPPFGD